MFGKSPNKKKLKIGYISLEFNDSPLAFLMRNVFELHNKDLFEVYGFAVEKIDES